MSELGAPISRGLRATNTANGFAPGSGVAPTPLRRAILLALARADSQPWTSDQDGSGWTDHMAEMMYGKQADVVEQLLKEMRTIAHTAGWDAAMAFMSHRVEEPCST